MLYFLLTSFLLVTAILSPGCSQERSSDNSSWSIDYRSSGGFSGGGNGNLTVDSNGQVSYSRPGIPNKQTKPCAGTLSKEEVRELSSLVARAKPDGWQVDGLNVAAADAFEYFLFLHKGKQAFNVKWYDNTRDKLPDDLKSLTGSLDKLKDLQAKKCAEK